MNGSSTMSFGLYETKKVLKGAGIAAAGAVLSYIAMQVIPSLSLGDYAWLVPIMSVAVNALLQLVKNNQ